ncbi:hypothetical protein HUJ04_010018 [Dendroctonus ponderosae]|nr:hypothetical protein HUJ04_010018 [Dendroctonus ponderosae]
MKAAAAILASSMINSTFILPRKLEPWQILDCLRRIHKGKADFGVFTAEDLVAAANSEIDVLLTNELRFSSDQNFEYELVAVVANAANIRQKHDLRGKKYCHPGYGYEADWTRILSNSNKKKYACTANKRYRKLDKSTSSAYVYLSRFNSSSSTYVFINFDNNLMNFALIDQKIVLNYRPVLCTGHGTLGALSVKYLLLKIPISMCSTYNAFFGSRGRNSMIGIGSVATPIEIVINNTHLIKHFPASLNVHKRVRNATIANDQAINPIAKNN